MAQPLVSHNVHVPSLHVENHCESQCHVLELLVTYNISPLPVEDHHQTQCDVTELQLLCEAGD